MVYNILCCYISSTLLTNSSQTNHPILYNLFEANANAVPAQFCLFFWKEYYIVYIKLMQVYSPTCENNPWWKRLAKNLFDGAQEQLWLNALLSIANSLCPMLLHLLSNALTSRLRLLIILGACNILQIISFLNPLFLFILRNTLTL